MSFNKVNSDGSLTRVAGGTLYADAPVGAIIPYGGTTAPDGFLFCQGQAVSRTTYAELFKVIGTAFGAGDGSTTFNVPDLREATTKGVGLSGKSNNHFDSDGVALGEFVEDRMQDHRHTSILSSPDNPGSTTAWTPAITPNLTVVQLADSFIAEGRTGATTEVKAVGVNYIIKAAQVGAPADFAPVDTVESGNMKPVTSNAVAGMNIESHTLLATSLPANGVPVAVAQITVPKGKWLILGQLHTQPYTDGENLLSLAISSSTLTAITANVAVDQRRQVSGIWGFVHGMLIVNPTAGPETIKLYGASNIAVETIKSEIVAIKIAE